MLDQNTDRMWFVIGAVIVGAAIIFIANGTLPDVFASVTETFQDAAGMATEEIERQFPPEVDLAELIDGKSPATVRYVGEADVNYINAKKMSYNSSTRTFDMNLSRSEAWKWSSGFRIKDSSRFVVPYGSILKIEYEVYAPKDMYAVNDINNSLIRDDGTLHYVNDGDDVTNRIGQVRRGEKNLPEMFVPANQWTKLTMVYRNKNNPRNNPNDLSMVDSTIFGLKLNDEDVGNSVNVQFRNIKISVYEPEE